ncbi:MAG TPA: PepSY domain-containing protein, partial [Acidimicrobiia bacterium]|nr:PepSY domain-containing protein [Acidimicrobiia bacterium]
MKTEERPTDLDGDVVDIDGGSAPRRKPDWRDRFRLPSRSFTLKVHRWLSLGALIWILIISLTGVVLVFAPQITARARPELFKATPGEMKSPQEMVDAALAHFPNDDVAIDDISFPVDNRGVYVLDLRVSPRPTPEQLASGAKLNLKTRLWIVYIDPATGQVNGTRRESEGFIYWCKRGHYILWQDNGFLGIAGDDLAGLVALAMFIITVTGFYIWYFPKVKHWFRNLRIRTRQGFFLFNLDLHRTLGLLILLPLAVISFTGATFSFPDMKLLWERLTPAKLDYTQNEPAEPPESQEPDEGKDFEVLTTDGAWQLIKQRYPNHRLNSLEPPVDSGDVWGAWLSRGYNPRQRDNDSGNMYVAVDRFRHEVVYEGTPEQGNVWDQVWEDWGYPLHAGDFLGNTSRWAWVFVGVSPVVLSGTGVVVWWKRRKRRLSRPAAVSTATATGAAGRRPPAARPKTPALQNGGVVIDLTGHDRPPCHADHVDRLTELFVTRTASQARVRVRGPVRLDAVCQPVPDIALVRPREYGEGHPEAADTLLVVEVSDASGDRETELLLYALAGIPEVWVVDVAAGMVEVFAGPRPSGWAAISRHHPGETLRPVGAADAT